MLHRQPGKSTIWIVPNQSGDSKVVFLQRPPKKHATLKSVALVIITGFLPGLILGASVVAFCVLPHETAKDFYWNQIARLESLLRNQSKYNSIPEECMETDAASSIDTKSEDALILKREAPQALAWGQERLTINWKPFEVQHGIFAERRADLKNRKVVDNIVVPMDRGLKSLMYHF